MAVLPSEDEPKNFRLTRGEEVVLRELARRDESAEGHRIGAAYRRLLELVRDDSDPTNPILAAHLVREIISAVPGALGVELPHQRFQYENQVQQLSELWQPKARTSDPPQRAVALLRTLLNEHDAASGRARKGAEAFILHEDPSRMGFAPDPSVRQWTTLQGRGSGMAHRLRNQGLPLPTPAEARRLADELTSMLFGTLAPFFEGLETLDGFLKLESPGPDDASHVATLLRTPSQYAYFFDRADSVWLPVLAEIPRLLTTVPPLVQVGDGFQVPAWPQGRFLARVGSAHPNLSRTLAAQVLDTNNPRVVHDLVALARSLDGEPRAAVAEVVCSRIMMPLAVDFVGPDAMALIRELAAAGDHLHAASVLFALVDAITASPRDHNWLLEKVLGDPLSDVVAISAVVSRGLVDRLRRSLEHMGPSRRYSTLWSARLDRPPRYGDSEQGMLARALLRSLLLGATAPSQAVFDELLGDSEGICRRIALGALAQRAALATDADRILSEPSAWDEEETRFDFRAALPVLWDVGSSHARGALLRYAADASEAVDFAARLKDAAVKDLPSQDAVVRQWRSRLLSSLRDRLPAEWIREFGPVDATDTAAPPEPTTSWIPPRTPYSIEELTPLEPQELIRRLREWEPDPGRTFDSPDLEGLAQVSANVICGRLVEFLPLGEELAGLRLPIVAAVAEAIVSRIRATETDLQDRRLGTTMVLALAEVLLTRPNSTDSWATVVKRDAADSITLASKNGVLDAALLPRLISLLRALLVDSDPVPGEEAEISARRHAPMDLALTTVRGSATSAAIEIILWGHTDKRAEDRSSEMSDVLLEVVRRDTSLAVRAALGVRLPWLLVRDARNRAEWLTVLFGDDVPLSARSACWNTYLTYSRFFRDSAELLIEQYAKAVDSMRPSTLDSGDDDPNPTEHLGGHLATAHVLGMSPDGAGTWLQRFYARAGAWLRARTTRVLADCVGSSDASPTVRARARRFLLLRLEARGEEEADVEELKALTWASRTPDSEQEVLSQVVLPALERTGGAAADDTGVAELIARTAQADPISAARALRLVVDGDPWNALPMVAASELREALAVLLGAAPETAREAAKHIIHDLGARGFLEFRDLLPPA